MYAVSTNGGAKPVYQTLYFLESSASGSARLRLFPDGNTGLVFCLEGVLGEMSAARFPGLFVYGQMDNFRDVIRAGSLGLAIVVFQPYGLYRLLKIPATELKGNIIEARFLFGKIIDEVGELLYASLRPAERAAVLDNFFLRLSQRPPNGKDGLIRAAAALVTERKGMLRIGELCDFDPGKFLYGI